MIYWAHQVYLGCQTTAVLHLLFSQVLSPWSQIAVPARIGWAPFGLDRLSARVAWPSNRPADRSIPSASAGLWRSGHAVIGCLCGCDYCWSLLISPVSIWYQHLMAIVVVMEQSLYGSLSLQASANFQCWRLPSGQNRLCSLGQQFDPIPESGRALPVFIYCPSMS